MADGSEWKCIIRIGTDVNGGPEVCGEVVAQREMFHHLEQHGYDGTVANAERWFILSKPHLTITKTVHEDGKDATPPLFHHRERRATDLEGTP